MQKKYMYIYFFIYFNLYILDHGWEDERLIDLIFSSFTSRLTCTLPPNRDVFFFFPLMVCIFMCVFTQCVIISIEWMLICSI